MKASRIVVRLESRLERSFKWRRNAIKRRL